jgi:hypothetical protein
LFPVTVTVVVSPAIHEEGEMEEMDGCAQTQSSCAWQTAGENRKKAAQSSSNDVATWGNGLLMAPPPISQGLVHGGAVLSWVGYESWPKNGSWELYSDSGTKYIKNTNFGNIDGGGD